MMWLTFALLLALPTTDAIDAPRDRIARAPAGAPSKTIGTLTLDVKAARSISRSVVRKAIAETAAIWKGSGVALRFAETDASADSTDPLDVRVIVDDDVHDRAHEDRGAGPGPGLANETPLGWITFDDVGLPERIIHLSYRHAARLLERTAAYRERPTLERELLLGRALGRALAHELGHFMLASKAHSSSGLMRSRHPLDEFLSPARAGFRVGAYERGQLQEQLRAGRALAAPDQDPVPVSTPATPPFHYNAPDESVGRPWWSRAQCLRGAVHTERHPGHL